MRQRFEFLEHFRGIAILCVLAYHAALEVSSEIMRWNGMWWDPFAYDPVRSALHALMQSAAVPTAFFMMSGFLVHMACERRLAQPQHSLADFVLRRALRLYVPYVVILLGFALLFPPTLTPPTSRYNLFQLGSHIGVFFNLNDRTLWTINASFWYIATELQMCLLYPLVRWGSRRFGWSALLAFLAAVQVASQAGSTLLALHAADVSIIVPGDNWLGRCPLSYCFSWVLGARIAAQYMQGEISASRRSPVLGWALLALGATVFLPTSVIAITIVTMAYAAAMRAMLIRRPQVPTTGRNRTLESLQFLGSIGLALYLLNQPIIRVLHRLLLPWIGSPALRLAITVLAALAVVTPLAWVFTRFAEPPLQRLASRVAELSICRIRLLWGLIMARPRRDSTRATP